MTKIFCSQLHKEQQAQVTGAVRHKNDTCDKELTGIRIKRNTEGGHI